MNPARCIYCRLPADRRTGKVTTLPNGTRIHNRCAAAVVVGWANAMAAHKPRRPSFPNRP